MTGIEVAVGFLIAWPAKKAHRVGKRADEIADDTLDLSLDRLHDVAPTDLGGDASLVRLEATAVDGGEIAVRVRQRVQLTREDAVAVDAEFAQRLEQAVRKTQAVSAGSNGIHATTRGGPVGGGVSGIVATGDNATITQQR